MVQDWQWVLPSLFRALGLLAPKAQRPYYGYRGFGRLSEPRA